jgi:hypothetical protein
VILSRVQIAALPLTHTSRKQQLAEQQQHSDNESGDKPSAVDTYDGTGRRSQASCVHSRDLGQHRTASSRVSIAARRAVTVSTGLSDTSLIAPRQARSRAAVPRHNDDPIKMNGTV